MTKTVSVAAFLDRLEASDAAVDIPDDIATMANADLGLHLNLNAIAIGLGLEPIEYEPEEFPGLIYTPKEYDETFSVLFGHGIIFVASAESIDAREIVDHVINRLDELGLVDEMGSVDVVHSPTEIQIPSSCPSCGTELSGDETTCPECGADLSAD